MPGSNEQTERKLSILAFLTIFSLIVSPLIYLTV